MKKLIVFLLVLVLSMIGCSFNFQVMTPEPATETLQPVTPVTPSPVPTLQVTVVTPFPNVFIPTTSDPVFYGTYLKAEQDGISGQPRFPAGIKQVFAVWKYQNMRAGLNIKREWYLDGVLWLVREEEWDFIKYGERGTVEDISIQDFEIGLPSGVYQLFIFIDGTAQPIGNTTEGGADTFVEFEILPPIEAKSPNGEWIASANLERLLLVDSNGTQVDLFVGREISAVAWLPDNEHLLFVDRDRSNQLTDLLVGVHDDLWIADIVNREAKLVYASDTRINNNDGLLVSPDGRHVASHEGSGFGDACFVDVRMLFFEIAEDYQSVKTINQKQFTGLPVFAEGVVFPIEKGRWEANGQFVVPLGITCTSEPAVPATYVFDMAKLTATTK
jgi:hypothetical protein